MKPILFSSLVVAACCQTYAGDFSLSAPLTDDAGSGISSANTYTHAISGGKAVTVNGVSFEALRPSVTPSSISWTSTGGKNEVLDNNGDWNPAAGGVTGPGLIGLFQSFTYAGSGADPGSSQTFTLKGLSAGTLYDTRLYIRTWDTEASGRPIDFAFTSGSQVDSYKAVFEDRPGTVLGTANQNQAFYLNYRFAANASDLIIDASVPMDAIVGSGSFHLYALTSQVVPEPGTLALLGLSLGLLGAKGLARRRG